MSKRKQARTVSQVRAWANMVAVVRDAVTGEVLQTVRKRNLVTAAGLNLLCMLAVAQSTSTITHFGYGTGTTAATAADTALETQVARDAITSRTASGSSFVVTYYLPTGSGNGSTITEVGLFTAAVSGTMLARAVLGSSIVKTSSVTVTFTWTVTLSAA